MHHEGIRVNETVIKWKKCRILKRVLWLISITTTLKFSAWQWTVRSTCKNYVYKLLL